MLKYILGSASALALLSAPAAAATFTVGAGEDKALIPANDFKAELEALGFDLLRNNASLALNGPAKVKVELLGSESGASDRIKIGDFTHTQEPNVSAFGAPILLANLKFTNTAAFSVEFSSSLSNFETLHTPGSGEFGFFIPGATTARQFAAGDYTSNVLYLGYDNQLTNVDDDNHDDLVIRLTATAVPEPATWAMMIGGFGLVGAAARRRVHTVTYA